MGENFGPETSAKYNSFLHYLRTYYFGTRDFSFIKNDLFSHVIEGDLDTTNNTSETLNNKLNKRLVGGFQSLSNMARAIYENKYNLINEKHTVLSKNRLRKRDKRTIDRFERITSVLSEYNDKSHSDQCSVLIETLSTLGSPLSFEINEES